MLVALILAIVILAGSVITAVAMIKQEQQNSQEQNTNSDGMIDLISCEEEDIERVTIDSAKDTYSVIRDAADADGITWIIENRDNTDISQYNLMMLINRCTTLRALRFRQSAFYRRGTCSLRLRQRQQPRSRQHNRQKQGRIHLPHRKQIRT